MLIQTFILACCVVLLAGCAATKSRVPVSDIGRRTIVLGGLGRPIGQQVMIHGYKIPQEPMLNHGSFLVDAVDGQRLERPVTILVRGIHEWDDGTVATICGYEVGTIRFEHIDDANYGPDDPRFTPHQVVWMHFEASDVIEPRSLKLGGEQWSFY